MEERTGMISSGVIIPYDDGVWITYSDRNNWQGKFFFFELEEINNGYNATTSNTATTSCTTIRSKG